MFKAMLSARVWLTCTSQNCVCCLWRCLESPVLSVNLILSYVVCGAARLRMVSSPRVSESTSVDDSDHHDVSDGGDDGDPEPDGVAGHGLWLLLLARCGRCRRCCVHAGRGVKERVLRAAVVQRRCVHERAAAHHRKLKHSSAGHWLWCTGVCVCAQGRSWGLRLYQWALF